MARITWWARNGEAVRQAIALGDIAHLETASEEWTEEWLLFAIARGLLKAWANAFPEPRRPPEMGREVSLPAHLAARFAGRYSRRKTGDVLRSARVLGAWGSSVAVVEPAQGLSGRGPSDDKRFSGDVGRKLLVQMAQQADLSPPVRLPPQEPRVAVQVRQRASRRARTQVVDEAEAAARAQQVAEQLMDWANQHVGGSLLNYARLGTGRRLHSLDTTPGEGAWETGT